MRRSLPLFRAAPVVAASCLGALLFAPLIACQSTYYRTMEAFGQQKRDILTDRVQEARQDQEEAKEQFASALDRFTALLNDPGSTELRKTYDTLKDDLDRSESKAEDVRGRIDAVESVGEDLFKEWEAELGQYSSDELRRTSEQQLGETRGRYDGLVEAMNRAESKMAPVLAAFRDQVLFLKHNLNARAIASLKGNVGMLESDIAALIREMEASIAEADGFIESMKLDR